MLLEMHGNYRCCSTTPEVLGAVNNWLKGKTHTEQFSKFSGLIEAVMVI